MRLWHYSLFGLLLALVLIAIFTFPSAKDSADTRMETGANDSGGEAGRMSPLRDETLTSAAKKASLDESDRTQAIESSRGNGDASTSVDVLKSAAYTAKNPSQGSSGLETSLNSRNAELMSFMSAIQSDYATYDKQTLIALAEQGDAAALFKLSGYVTPLELCSYATAPFAQGKAMAYLPVADVALHKIHNPVVARAYFYASLNSKSELAKMMEGDYLKATNLSADQALEAQRLAERLVVQNDCAWAKSSNN